MYMGSHGLLGGFRKFFNAGHLGEHHWITSGMSLRRFEQIRRYLYDSKPAENH